MKFSQNQFFEGTEPTFFNKGLTKTRYEGGVIKTK